MAVKESKLKIPVALCMALGVGLLVSVMIGMLGAALIHWQTLQENAAGWVAMVALFLGSLICALFAILRMGQMRLVMALAAGGAYLLGLFCCSAILFDGIKSGVGATVAVIVGGAAVAFLLGMERKKKPKYRVPKVRM